MRLCLALLIPLFLAACETTGTGSIKGGECKVFERPDYVVLGKKQYDQSWIDGNIEAGVGGCGWTRPKPRPPSLDGQTRAPAVLKKAKPSLRARIKATIRPAPPPAIPAPAEEPVPQSAPELPVTTPAVVAAPPIPPRDELLEPSAMPDPPVRKRHRWCPTWLCGGS